MMDFIAEIANRKLDVHPKISFCDQTIKIVDIRAEINIPNSFVIDENRDFKAHLLIYKFPSNDRLSAKDHLSLKSSIFPPLFTLKNRENNNGNPRAFILGYLYNREALTGSTYLKIRSIVKFEMMMVPYFIEDFAITEKPEPKNIIISSYPACISPQINFTINDLTNDVQYHLRILMIDIKSYVLAFYIIENEFDQFSKRSIEELIESIYISIT